MTDSLGDRMKHQYEDRYRFSLPRRTYTIIRCDGRAFHSYTRQCKKPHDPLLAQAMDFAASRLCQEAQGAVLAYTQSDEISVVLTDFALPQTEAWFDGNLQKIVSISAAVVTQAFFDCVAADFGWGRPVFDARVFTIPDPTEVENYFIWRQKDAERNSLAGLAQVHYSPSQLRGKGKAEQHDMLHAKGVNWNDLPPAQKRGRCVVRDEERGWRLDAEIPVFTQDRSYMRSRIPLYEQPVETGIEWGKRIGVVDAPETQA